MKKEVLVIKRDLGREPFSPLMIEASVKGAMRDLDLDTESKENEMIVNEAINRVYEYILEKDCNELSVDTIESIILPEIAKFNEEISKAYIRYREMRRRHRTMETPLMKAIGQIGISTTRDNANVGNNFSSKLLNIASAANKQFNLLSMPVELAELHEQYLYFHDLDSYNLTTNCLQHSAKVLGRPEGLNTGYGTLNRPQRIETYASNICILIQSAQNKQNCSFL